MQANKQTSKQTNKQTPNSHTPWKSYHLCFENSFLVLDHVFIPFIGPYRPTAFKIAVSPLETLTQLTKSLQKHHRWCQLPRMVSCLGVGKVQIIDFRCFFFHSRNGFTWPKYVGGILLKNLWKSFAWPSRPSRLSRYWSNHFLTCVGLGRVTLPETNMAPTRKPWWKGNDCLPGPPFFRCQFSFRECCKRFRWTEKLESPYKAVTTIRELKQVISTDILPTPFRFGILNCFLHSFSSKSVESVKHTPTFWWKQVVRPCCLPSLPCFSSF